MAYVGVVVFGLAQPADLTPHHSDNVVDGFQRDEPVVTRDQQRYIVILEKGPAVAMPLAEAVSVSRCVPNHRPQSFTTAGGSPVGRRFQVLNARLSHTVWIAAASKPRRSEIAIGSCDDRRHDVDVAWRCGPLRGKYRSHTPSGLAQCTRL
jgi:hypothetical protein